ncbi:MAG: hypothetical protein AB1509_10455 [Chloroflexota bacterium]
MGKRVSQGSRKLSQTILLMESATFGDKLFIETFEVFKTLEAFD